MGGKEQIKCPVYFRNQWQPKHRQLQLRRLGQFLKQERLHLSDVAILTTNGSLSTPLR